MIANMTSSLKVSRSQTPRQRCRENVQLVDHQRQQCCGDDRSASAAGDNALKSGVLALAAASRNSRIPRPRYDEHIGHRATTPAGLAVNHPRPLRDQRPFAIGDGAT